MATAQKKVEFRVPKDERELETLRRSTHIAEIPVTAKLYFAQYGTSEENPEGIGVNIVIPELGITLHRVTLYPSVVDPDTGEIEVVDAYFCQQKNRRFTAIKETIPERKNEDTGEVTKEAQEVTAGGFNLAKIYNAARKAWNTAKKKIDFDAIGVRPYVYADAEVEEPDGAGSEAYASEEEAIA